MSANQVIEKILSEAQAEAENIKKEADKEAQQLQQQFQGQLDRFEKETQRLAEAKTEEVKAQTLAAARMEIAKESLAAKNKLLNETFDSAAEKIKNMPTEDYQQMIERLLVSAVRDGDEEVVIDKDEKRIDDEFVKKINEKLAQDNKGNLKISQTRADIGAGFLLQKGKTKVNASLKVLLETAKEKLQGELANEIFAK